MSIQDGLITRLVEAFPDASVFTGKVIQGVQPDNIIVNTVLNQTNIFKGSPYRQREITIQVSVIQPTDEDIADKIIEALLEVTVNGITHYPDSVFVEDSDGVIRVLFDFVHLER